MPSQYLPLIILPAFVLGFPLFWMGVVYLISLMSGWHGLARRFRCEKLIPETRRAMAYIGLARYNGVLRVGYDRAGVYLGVNVLFRAGHPTLFIPWREVASAQMEKGLFGMDMARLEVRDGPTIKLYGDWAALVKARSEA